MFSKPKNKKLYQESQGTESETNKNFFRNKQ